MRTGRIEANLAVLNEGFKLPYIDDLIAHKIGTAEHATLRSADLDFHTVEIHRLLAKLEQSAAQSTLPHESNAQRELNELLVRIRVDS